MAHEIGAIAIACTPAYEVYNSIHTYVGPSPYGKCPGQLWRLADRPAGMARGALFLENNQIVYKEEVRLDAPDTKALLFSRAL